MKRIAVFVMAAATLWTAENWWLNARQADSATALALAQMAGGNPPARALREFTATKDLVHVAVGVLIVARRWGTTVRSVVRPLRIAETTRVAPDAVAVRLAGRGLDRLHAAVVAAATHLTFTTGAVIPVDGGLGM